MVAISAVIITFNEQANIGRCLDALTGVADEILVVDSFSTDETPRICAQRGVLFHQHAFAGHVQQKNFAVDQARHDRILSLDADEVLSDRLTASILDAKNNWRSDAYSLNRRTNYCGQWINHCGWYPDRKIRLWDRRRGRWGGINPHDRVVMHAGARVEHLDGDLMHYSYRSVRQHLDRINTFSDIAAGEAFKAGRRPRLVSDMVLNPALTFLKKYFLQKGVLDGYAGLVIAANSAYGKFLKYAKLRELARQQPPDGKPNP